MIVVQNYMGSARQAGIETSRHTPSAGPRAALTLFLVAMFAGQTFTQEPSKPRPGLILKLERSGVAHSSVVSNVWLFVGEGQTANPFLEPGPFTATWSGRVSVDLRSDLLFQAEINGELELEINGTNVLKASGSGIITPHTRSIRLTKGPNPIRVVYKSAAKGDSYLRLLWAEKPFLTTPIPHTQLDHLPTPDSILGEQRLKGREIFIERRCAACHGLDLKESALPELSMDAPTFEGIGTRRNGDWLRRWIADPHALRAQARMPRVLQGKDSTNQIHAIAAYLVSLKMGGELEMKDPIPWTHLAPAPATGDGEKKPLLESLLCASCHVWPGSENPDETKISLAHVINKFPSGKLAEFLRKPEAHYAWTRMPNFRLNQAEAGQLAKELVDRLEKAPAIAPDPSTEETLIQQGRERVASSGCLNCHRGPGETKFKARPLKDLKPSTWDKGCLAATEAGRGAAPDFALNDEQRLALKAFGQTDHSSLKRHVPAEFAERHKHQLRCISCHGPAEGFPSFDVLGGKLQPEWAHRFIAGEISYKPREERHPKGEPWLEARMPAFPAYASLMANGMAESHGYSSSTPNLPPVDQDLAEMGRKLVGKAGGFSCISCHGVGAMAAMEVFESEGINLAHSGNRIRKEYYRRWMKQPMAVDPSTKMPAYFDEEGKSPLAEILDGDASKQLDAVWEYLRLGETMIAPSTGQ